MHNELNEFCRKYEASVGPSMRRHWRSRRANYSEWSTDPYAMTADQDYQNVTMVEIHMPQDRFRAMLEYNEWLEKSRVNDEIDRKFFVHQQEEEIRLRQQHPGLLDLYEKYQTMLQLVK